MVKRQGWAEVRRVDECIVAAMAGLRAVYYARRWVGIGGGVQEDCCGWRRRRDDAPSSTATPPWLSQSFQNNKSILSNLVPTAPDRIGIGAVHSVNCRTEHCRTETSDGPNKRLLGAALSRHRKIVAAGDREAWTRYRSLRHSNATILVCRRRSPAAVDPSAVLRS